MDEEFDWTVVSESIEKNLQRAVHVMSENHGIPRKEAANIVAEVVTTAFRNVLDKMDADNETIFKGMLGRWVLISEWHGLDGEPAIDVVTSPGAMRWDVNALLTEAMNDSLGQQLNMWIGRED